MSTCLLPVVKAAFAEYAPASQPKGMAHTKQQPLQQVSLPDAPTPDDNSDEDWFDVALAEDTPTPSIIETAKAWLSPTATTEQATAIEQSAPETNAFAKADTHIPAQCEIAGDLQLNGENAFIDGVIVGSVTNQNGAITLGRHAIIHGDVTAKAISVEGLVCGNLTAANISLKPNCSIQGNIVYAQSLEVKENAEFCGSVSRAASA